MILGDWLCWVLSGMWGGREWWDPPAAAGRVRGEGSAEMRPGARKAAGGDGYASRMNWGGWGALWGARGTIAGFSRDFYKEKFSITQTPQNSTTTRPSRNFARGKPGHCAPAPRLKRRETLPVCRGNVREGAATGGAVSRSGGCRTEHPPVPDQGEGCQALVGDRHARLVRGREASARYFRAPPLALRSPFDPGFFPSVAWDAEAAVR